MKQKVDSFIQVIGFLIWSQHHYGRYLTSENTLCLPASTLLLMDSSVFVDTEIEIDDQAGKILKEFPDIDETSLGEDICLP